MGRLSVRVNGSWTAPQPVFGDNWQINGCPVNGPAVAAEGAKVAVAWFSSVAESPRVKIAFSKDAGATFGQPIKVRRVRPDGSVGPAAVIADTDISRSSGFPRMARLGDQVHFAWTEFGKPARVRTAVTDLNR